MILTRSQRKHYGIAGRPLSRLPKVGDRIQYLYKRDDGTLVHHKCTVIPYDSPSALKGELVLIHHDNPLTNDTVIWDFDLRLRSDKASPFYLIRP